MKQDNLTATTVYNFPAIGDENGYLSVVESNHNIPFEVKRVFYIYGTKADFVRGRHAHYKMREVLVSVSGRCTVFLDSILYKETIILDSPNKAVLVEPYHWREMYDFSDDCVLLALASEFYDPDDYIRIYSKFLEVYSNSFGDTKYD